MTSASPLGTSSAMVSCRGRGADAVTRRADAFERARECQGAEPSRSELAASIDCKVAAAKCTTGSLTRNARA